ncbi:MAG: hypothetical protein U0X75_28970 [Acidobacteriota bacterium]
MTDHERHLVYKGQFDPYGQALSEWSATGNTNLNTKKFTGYERDAAKDWITPMPGCITLRADGLRRQIRL